MKQVVETLIFSNFGDKNFTLLPPPVLATFMDVINFSAFNSKVNEFFQAFSSESKLNFPFFMPSATFFKN